MAGGGGGGGSPSCSWTCACATNRKPPASSAFVLHRSSKLMLLDSPNSSSWQGGGGRRTGTGGGSGGSQGEVRSGEKVSVKNYGSYSTIRPKRTRKSLPTVAIVQRLATFRSPRPQTKETWVCQITSQGQNPTRHFPRAPAVRAICNTIRRQAQR